MNSLWSRSNNTLFSDSSICTGYDADKEVGGRYDAGGRLKVHKEPIKELPKKRPLLPKPLINRRVSWAPEIEDQIKEDMKKAHMKKPHGITLYKELSDSPRY